MNNTRASPIARESSVCTSFLDEPTSLDLKYSRSDLARTGLILPVVKSSAIVLLLGSALAVASIWTTSGAKFIYDSPTSSSPLLRCPAVWNYDAFSQAPYCKVQVDIVAMDVYKSLTSGDLTAKTDAEAQAKGLCVVPAVDESEMEGPDAPEKIMQATNAPIVCYSKQSCRQTTNWRVLNPYSLSSLNQHQSFVACQFQVQSTQINTVCSTILQVDSYCDSAFTVTPSAVISIRGAIAGLILLWLFLMSHDLYQFFVVSRHNTAVLKFRKSFFAKHICNERFELYNWCLSMWNSHTAPSTIQRSLTNASIPSSPLVRTPSSSILSSSVSVLNQPIANNGIVPFQPVLTPRKSVVSDFKNSPRGYTPRLDSPPVAVVSSISVASKKLTRFNGSVDIMFKTSWKKRIAKHFKSHSQYLRSVVKLKRFTLRSIALSLVIISVFILLFRLMFVMQTHPFVTQMPEGVSIYSYLGLPAIDKVYSRISDLIWSDLRRKNFVETRFLVMWADFLIYLDVLYESMILLVFAFFSIGFPTNVSKKDKAAGKFLMQNQPPSARLAATKNNGMIVGDEVFMMDDHTKAPPSIEDSSLSPAASNFSSPVHMIQPKQFVSPKQLVVQIPKLIGSPFGNKESEYDDDDQALTAGRNVDQEFGPMDPLPSQSSVCIMMSVSSPCATKTSRRDFILKLQSLRQLVESDIDIFVVDCGSTREPIDDTEYIIKSEVSDKINYVYFPESNRVLSLYWTSKYWIPFLFSANLCGDYIYALMVDEQVSFDNANFKLPSTEFLMKNPRIKTMYVPVRESPRIFSSDFMDRWKEKIQLNGVHLACGQSTTHSGDVGVPQIWERNTFEMTCFNLVHRPESRMLSLMELKANGRQLLRHRGSSKQSIWISGNGRCQPQFTGARKLLGFRNSKISIFSNMHELIDPSSFLHWTSVLSKFIVLGEIANTFFDSIRIFLLPGLLLKDPVGFAATSVIVAIVALLPYLVNLLVNIKYEDHRLLKTLYIVFVYPFQLILKELPRRSVAFFKEYIRDVLFTKYEADLTIGEREEQFRDLPLVPPHPHPHWSTVWM